MRKTYCSYLVTSLTSISAIIIGTIITVISGAIIAFTTAYVTWTASFDGLLDIFHY